MTNKEKIKKLINHLKTIDSVKDDPLLIEIANDIDDTELVKVLYQINRLCKRASTVETGWDDNVLFNVIMTPEGVQFISNGSISNKTRMWSEFFSQHPHEYIIIQESIEILRMKSLISELLEKKGNIEDGAYG